MLLCDQKTYYVGTTDDIRRRLKQHRHKTSFYTKQFSDIVPIYLEKYLNQDDAVRREKQIKGWSRIKKQKLVKGELGINSIDLAEGLLGYR